MSPTDLFLFHDRSSSDDSRDLDDGPRSPRPQDPGPEGGEGEPAGDDDDDRGSGDADDEEPETRRNPPAAPRETGNDTPRTSGGPDASPDVPRVDETH